MIKLAIEKILTTSKTLKVLYVEDNMEARESTLLMLKNFFDDIVVGVDGNNGLDLYNNHFDNTNSYFDIVISDIHMPYLDGIGMSKAIYDINKDQKIIIISAYSDKEYLIPLLNMGVEGFMQKPLSFEQVTEVVKSICQTFEDSSIIKLAQSYSYNRVLSTLFEDKQKINLHNNEVKLLELFLDNIDKDFTITDIFTHIFFDEPYKEFSSDSIRALIKRLRKKLPDNSIVNSRTLGYRINLPK